MHRLVLAILSAMLLTLGGCGKVKDIKVTSVKVESIAPQGLQGINVFLIYNDKSLSKMFRIFSTFSKGFCDWYRAAIERLLLIYNDIDMAKLFLYNTYFFQLLFLKLFR
jgi:hypothetical protein